MQSATGANAHELKCAMGFVFEASLEIDVGKSIELVHHDVDVVASDACGEHGEALALIGSGDGVKLAIAYLTLLAIEMGGHEVYAARVAHEDDLVGQLFGQQVEVEYATIAIDNEF